MKPKEKLTVRVPPVDDAEEEPTEDVDFILDWTPGSKEREAFATYLALTHSSEQVNEILKYLDMEIEATQSMKEDQRGEV